MPKKKAFPQIEILGFADENEGVSPYGATTHEGATRNPFAVANDWVIEGVNAGAGALKTVSDFVSPGNPVSRALDSFIELGEEHQSDVVKAAKAKLAQELGDAEGFTDEAAAFARYILNNPGLAAAYLVGNIALPIGAVKGGVKGAQLASRALGGSPAQIAAAGVRGGRVAGAATGAAMTGGDAAGQAYDELTHPDRRKAVLASPRAQELLAQGVSADDAIQQIAREQGHKASRLPAAVGAAFGATGLERVIAGGRGAGRVATGLIEGAQGATDELISGISGGVAAQEIDPSVDPAAGAGANVVAGGVFEAVPGFVLGGRRESEPKPQGPLTRAADIAAGVRAGEEAALRALPPPPAQPAEWEVVDDRPQLGGPGAARLALGFEPEEVESTVMVDSRGNAMRAPDAWVIDAEARRQEAADLGLTPDVRAAQARRDAPRDDQPMSPALLALSQPTEGGRMVAGADGVRRSTFMEDQADAQRRAESEAMGLTADVRAAQARRMGGPRAVEADPEVPAPPARQARPDAQGNALAGGVFPVVQPDRAGGATPEGGARSGQGEVVPGAQPESTPALSDDATQRVTTDADWWRGMTAAARKDAAIKAKIGRRVKPETSWESIGEKDRERLRAVRAQDEQDARRMLEDQQRAQGEQDAKAETGPARTGTSPARVEAARRRKRAYREAEPFRSFLAEHGINVADRSDVGGERNRPVMVPYHGPLFRKNGLRLDELARRAVEAGFLTQADIDSPYDNGGVNKLSDMIRRMLAGERILPVAQQESEQEAEWRAQMEARYEALEEAEDAARAATDDEINALLQEVQDEDGELRREEAYEALELGEPQEAGRGADETAARAETRGDPRGSAETRDEGARAVDEDDDLSDIPFDEPGEPADTDDFLRSPTEGELRARSDAEERARAEQARREAAPPPEEFTLAGSDRPADQAAARGQQDLAPAARTPEQQPTARVEQRGRLEDFGEKLEGARKDQARDLSRELSDDEIAGQPLSKIWPATEVDAIEDVFVAAFAHAARAEIPSKPRQAYKLKRWVEAVKMLRGLAAGVVSGRMDRALVEERLRASRGLEGFTAKVDLLMRLDREQWKRIGGVREYPDAYTYDADGKKIPSPQVYVEIDGRTAYIKASRASDDVVLARVNSLLGRERAEKKMAFEVRKRRGSDKVFINKKGDPEYRPLKEFNDSKEAFAFIHNHYDELVGLWDAVKDSDNVRKTDVRRRENRQRTGADRRAGLDVTPEQFEQAFGFRGVQFGNWVAQGAGKKDRQGMLNEAYDALHDLAEIIGVPTRAISLDGTLGLAFGARGKGWASAHFEPNTLVINLTKTRGAGSLAHEWFHALDNYFARMRRGGEEMPATDPDTYYRGNFITYRPEAYYEKGGRTIPARDFEAAVAAGPVRNFSANPSAERRHYFTWRQIGGSTDGWVKRDAVRPQVEQRFAELVEALNASPMNLRSQSLDKGKSGYWSRIIERGARAFENFVIARMAQKGYHNDFLANVVSPEDFVRSADRYPYLRPDELAPIEQAFDNLFDTLETRQTDRGIALFEPTSQYRVDEPQDFQPDLFDQVPEQQGEDRDARSDRAGVRRDVQPASALSDTEAPAGEYFLRTVLGTETKRQLGASVIKTHADAARATRYLYRNAVERFDAIVTDRNGKPLGVVGGFKGDLAQSAVYIPTIIGEAVRIPGAARIWFSHNHPSGTAELSNADRMLNNALTSAFRGSGIEPMGILAVAGDAYAFEGASNSGVTGSAESNLPIQDGDERVEVPVVERMIARGGTAGQHIASTTEAKTAASIFYGRAKEPGLILLNAQNRVVAWVPLSSKMLGKLRDTGGLRSLYRAVSESTTAAAIMVDGGEIDALPSLNGVSVVENIGAALNETGVRLLDAVNAVTGRSRAEQGARLASGPVFSRSRVSMQDAARGSGRGMNEADVGRVADAMRAGWENGPEVVVVADMSDPRIPEAVRREDARQRSGGATGAPEGFFADGKVYLVASELDSAADVIRVLAHEALGHYGLRGLFGKRLAGILEQIIRARPKEIAAKLREYGLKDTPANRLIAAEEVLANMAQEQPSLGFVRRAIAAIRRWLRELGFNLRLSNDDIIANFILPARMFVTRRSTAERILSTIYTQFPGLKNYRYDFAKHRFVDRGGRPLDTARLERGEGSPDARGARAGEATLRRAIFLQSLASSSRSERPGLLEEVLRGGRSLVTDGDLGAMFSRRETKKKLADNIADLFQSHKGFNWWHRTIGTQYEKAQRNAHFGRVFDRAQSYLDDISDLANRAADFAPSILPKLNGIRDAFKKPVSKKDLSAIAAPIFQGTLADPDPAKGRVWTDAELKRDFKLTDEQIGLYREFRAAIDQSIDDLAKTDVIRFVGKEVSDAVRDRANQAADVSEAANILADELGRLAKENPQRADVLNDTAKTVLEKAKRAKGLMRGGYAPLMRFGRFSVYVTRGDEQVYFGMFETQREANRVARRFREDPDYADAKIEQGTMSQEAFKLFQGVTPETLELFGEVAGIEQNELFQKYLKLTRANRSAMKRLIQRKGVPGFSEDVSRVLAAFITSNARAGSANLHLGAMSELVEAIPLQQGDVKDEAVNLVEFVKGTNDPSSKLRGFLFIQFLGGSVASAFVNLTQSATTTYPFLAQFVGAGRAAVDVTRAMRNAATGVGSDADLAAALDRAESEGIVSPQEIHHLYSEAGVGVSRNNTVRRAAFLWGSLFSAAEQFNRRVAFIAAYRIGRQRGENAYEFARKAVQETQFIYSRASRPNWARNPVGASLMLFRSFTINYLEFLKRLPPKQQALALAVLMVAAGLEELPFADDADDVIDTVAQALGYNWNTARAKREFLARTLGERGAEFVLHGASAVPGFPMDVSARLGLGNLIPGTGLLLGSTRDKSREISEVLGAPGGFFESVIEGAGKALAGDLPGAGIEVAPLAVRNAVKALDMYQTGMYRDSRGRRVMDVDGYDALVKAIGFQPADVAAAQRKAGIVVESAALVRNVKSRIHEQMAEARFERDPEKMRKARQALRDWNRKNPEARILIDESAVNRRVKAMRATRAERLIKSTPKEIRRSIAEQL